MATMQCPLPPTQKCQIRISRKHNFLLDSIRSDFTPSMNLLLIHCHLSLLLLLPLYSSQIEWTHDVTQNQMKIKGQSFRSLVSIRRWLTVFKLFFPFFNLFDVFDSFVVRYDQMSAMWNTHAHTNCVAMKKSLTSLQCATQKYVRPKEKKYCKTTENTVGAHKSLLFRNRLTHFGIFCCEISKRKENKR